MTQLLDTPSSSASMSELADHAELICWQCTKLPLVQLARSWERLEENDYTHDGVPEEDPLAEIVENVLSEIDSVCQKTPISAELRASWPWFAYV